MGNRSVPDGRRDSLSGSLADHSGHTQLFCGDKEGRRKRLGEDMPPHFNTLLQGKGKLAFQILAKCECPERLQKLSFHLSSLSSLI